MAACARRHVSRQFRPLLGLQPRRARARRRGGAVSNHPAVDHPLLLSVPEGEAKRRAGRRGDAGTLALTGAMDAHRAAHICAASHRRGGSGRQSAASEVNEGQKLLVIAVVLSSPRFFWQRPRLLHRAQPTRCLVRFPALPHDGTRHLLLDRRRSVRRRVRRSAREGASRVAVGALRVLVWDPPSPRSSWSTRCASTRRPPSPFASSSTWPSKLCLGRGRLWQERGRGLSGWGGAHLRAWVRRAADPHAQPKGGAEHERGGGPRGRPARRWWRA